MWIGIKDKLDGFKDRILSINTDHIMAIEESLFDDVPPDPVTIWLQNGVMFTISRECFNNKLRSIIEEKLLLAPEDK